MQRSRVVTDEVRVMMDRQCTDVLLMQEPYNFRGAIPGFGTGTRVITGCSKDEQAMAAVAVRARDLTVVKIAHLCTSHCVCVHITRTRQTLYLVTQYFPPSEEIESSLAHLETVLRELRGKRVLLAADVNAKSPLWWSDHLDDRGEKLEELLSQHDLTVVNRSGFPATFSSPVGESNIDVTLAD
ncbi:hypothetical protein KM043_018809, partial [Ampulex compressa]